MRVLGVIPARYASSRFPGKPLAMIAGRTMIERVYRRAAGARSLDRLLVATDDPRIFAAVEAFGGQARQTSADCRSGLDRVAEVAAGAPEFELVVNIQGDEPLIEPALIDAAVELLAGRRTGEIATLVRPAADESEALDPNKVKAAMAVDGRVLYFSRAAIPFAGHGAAAQEQPFLIHLGLYVYRRAALLRLAGLPPSPLERRESLEQLRALEDGMSIYAARVERTISLGVDTPEDLARVEELILRLGLD